MLAVFVWVLVFGFIGKSAADNEAVYKGLKTFADVIQLIEKNYVDPVDPNKLIHDAIQGMVSGLDPHSALLDPEDFEDLQIDTQGEFTGIGVSISVRDGYITVVAPIEGTPAYKAGIKSGDIILKVDGKPIRGIKDAVKMMRGPKGSTVKVTIARKGVSEPMEFSLVRDVIPIESVHWAMLKPGYGYVWVTNFQDRTTEDLQSAIDAMNSGSAPLKGLVLDLRDDPGGLLPQAIHMADMFLSKGTILSIKGRLEQDTKVFKAHDEPTDYHFPVVVLINGGSASASEIVAGALQDNHRALIMGTTSFGKGSVQTVEPLGDGYGLKLTIARYYTPSGRSIQAKGIIPDIVVPAFTINPKKENSDDGWLKESDLRNHLKAEAPATPHKKTSVVGKEMKPAPSELVNRYGPVDVKRLKSDGQVMRALDFLIGYDILARAGK